MTDEIVKVVAAVLAFMGVAGGWIALKGKTKSEEVGNYTDALSVLLNANIAASQQSAIDRADIEANRSRIVAVEMHLTAAEHKAALLGEQVDRLKANAVKDGQEKQLIQKQLVDTELKLEALEKQYATEAVANALEKEQLRKEADDLRKRVQALENENAELKARLQ